MAPSLIPFGVAVDQTLELALADIVADDTLPLPDRACLLDLADARDPDDVAGELLELLGLPLDDARRAGERLAARLGAVRVRRCVDALVAALARHGVVLDRDQVRALAGT